jgi:catechol 2,3-dioxygenase-like lactoylglutathione lyase family enzyme
MKVYRISAVTLKVKSMEESCNFYSRIPGFKLVYGKGTIHDTFATYQIGKKGQNNSAYLNLELTRQNVNDKERQGEEKVIREEFGRIIFHTENVDSLYKHMKEEEHILKHESLKANH